MRLVLVAEVDEGNTSCHRSSIYKEQNIRTWLPSILLRNNKQYVVSRSADSSVNSTNAVAGSFQFVFVRPRCQGYEQSSAYLGVVSSMPAGSENIRHLVRTPHVLFLALDFLLVALALGAELSSSASCLHIWI
jgi:hypothetical protein